jgi:1-acyl-sn-glycerol-3-phosphate acyltransferase
MERSYRSLWAESAPRRRLRFFAYRFAYPFLRLTFNSIYGLKVIGPKRMSTPGPAIVVMNHCIHVEWFFVWHAAWPRFVRFTAEEANIRRPIGGLFNRMVGVIGIPDDNPMSMAPSVQRSINSDELLLFFPEGYLKLYNQNPSDFMIGAAWFACLHNTPLIPVSEVLLRRPIHRILPWWPPRIKLVVGDPIHPSEFRRDNERMRHLAVRITDYLELTIRDTIASEGNGYPPA